MVASNNNPIITFTYDARNRCIKRVINGTTNYLYYDNWDLIEEYDSNNNLLASYVHGNRMDEILTRMTPTAQIYYHHDALGSVTHLSDANGNIIEKYVYDPFGKPTILNTTNGILQTSAYGNRFLFTGREYLKEIGLYDYRNRYYSAELGRFLQTDPLGFGGGDINLYRYCGNNSVNWTDPFGLDSNPYDELDDRVVGGGGGGGRPPGIGGPTFPGGNLGGNPGKSPNPCPKSDFSRGSSKQPKPKPDNQFSKEKEALVDMAKADKQAGVTRADMEAYKDLNKQLPDPFPTDKVRIDEGHPSRSPHSQLPHGHMGPVDHIPIYY